VRSIGDWRRAVAAVCLALALQPAIGASDPQAARFYEDALVHFEKKDYKSAIIQLRNAIKLDRKMLQSQVLLGRALLAAGEANAAQVALEEALRLGVNPIEVVLPLAQALSAQGNPDAVLADTRFAHAGLPAATKSSLLIIKAAAASDLGRPKDAIKFLEEARALKTGDVESWTAEVPIRVRARQLSEAKAAADKAVTLDPRSPQAAYQQATVAHVTGDLKSAVSLYTRTLGLKSDHVDALVARAGLFVDLGQIAQATADVRAARSADPEDPRAAYLDALLAERAGDAAAKKAALTQVTNLIDPYPIEHLRYRPQVLMLGGLSHFGLKQFEKARPYLEMVVRQDAASPVSRLLAQIYLEAKQVDKAITALEDYLRIRPGDRQATVLLASSQMQMGRHARAAVLLEDVLKSGDDPEVRTLLGTSLVATGKFEPAVAELEVALKKEPGQVRAGVSLVSLYLASGQFAKAVSIVKGLLQRQPQNPGLHALLGSALAAGGEAAAARAAFEQALKLDPKSHSALLNLARLDIDSKRFDSALGRLNQLLGRDDKDSDAMLETARLFSARGQLEEAQRWLTKAEDNSGSRLQPGLQMIEFQLARGRVDLAQDAVKRLQAKAPEALLVVLAQAKVQIAARDLAAARSTLGRASTQVSYDAAALTRIAQMQLQADNVAGAAHALDKALQAKPTHLQARALRSSTYLLQGEMTKAEALARGILASEPKLALGYGLLGDLSMARKQPAAAIGFYSKALQLERTSQGLMRLFAAQQLVDQAAAAALAERWLRDHPQDLQVRRELADLQARSGNFASARAAYEGLLQLSPDDPEALNNLAIVLVSLGESGASKAAERALALKPQSAHILGTAGWAAFHAGQHDRALQLLRDARLRDPKNASTRYFLARVLVQQGRKDEARQELRAALTDDPRFAYAKDARALLVTLE
jgi:putative PEP-CTERM system TPR-repeat lipoprotein